MKIGELAAQTGVSERSLRYYEQQGLLTSDRTPGGHRVYPRSAVNRVVLIQTLLAAGLCSSKIAEVMPCMADHDGAPAPGTTSTPWLAQQLRIERERLDRDIRHLQSTREVLDEVIEAAASRS